ncbi:hypothetical protein BV22DRAFT_1167701 [Leucogyrophana mollusca]|uniref:Uncharacterized protein n=1 Tax=Leucogyrophana mollusca TaxID=85980 RepID=A0ACB8BDZ3_9AGAM|nr:hypothetical protein BV22DRAFT_1167701 [Leucogyrophana mollusca]
MALPAHHTKHLSALHYPFLSTSFTLAQRDDGLSNGTALWLGAQCLSLYLASLHTRRPASLRTPRAVELGSGVGLMPLALASLGYDVVATDIPAVTRSVLGPNIRANAGAGRVEVRVLDWTVDPGEWKWDVEHSVTPLGPVDTQEGLLAPPFDLIVSADTLYDPALVRPLLRTLHALSELSIVAGRAPPVYICLERRDPALIDAALAAARDEWGFAVERVPGRKVARAMERGGVRWAKSEWEGVEVWKLQLTPG